MINKQKENEEEFRKSIDNLGVMEETIATRQRELNVSM
jgi:hypothetical protein